MALGANEGLALRPIGVSRNERRITTTWGVTRACTQGALKFATSVASFVVRQNMVAAARNGVPGRHRDGAWFAENDRW